MTDDCMGCRVPGHSHAAYCLESRVEELRRDFEIEVEVNGVLRKQLAEAKARLAEEVKNKKEFERDWLAACDELCNTRSRLAEARGAIESAVRCLAMCNDGPREALLILNAYKSRNREWRTDSTSEVKP